MRLTGLELAPALGTAAIVGHVVQEGRGEVLATLTALLFLLVALRRSSTAAT